MDGHAESFLEMLAVERGAARNTLAAYRADLEDFAGFAAAHGQLALDAIAHLAHSPARTALAAMVSRVLSRTR